MKTPREMYEELKEKLAAEEIEVQEHGKLMDWEHELDGEFDSEVWDGIPQRWITIYRKHCAQFAYRDLLTLAHEYGHAISHRNGWQGAIYDQAIRRHKVEGVDWPDLLPEEKEAVFEEEQRAWCLGAVVLQGIGFTHWLWFRARVKASIFQYTKRLYPEEKEPTKGKRKA